VIEDGLLADVFFHRLIIQYVEERIYNSFNNKQRCGIISVKPSILRWQAEWFCLDMVGYYPMRYCMSCCVPIGVIEKLMYIKVGVLVLRLRNLFWIIPPPP
jgi:SUMO ligase MMS21 Smc5/6 complex component